MSQLGPRSGPTNRFVGPDLGPNCLPRLSADDTGRQRVKGSNGRLLFCKIAV